MEDFELIRLILQRDWPAQLSELPLEDHSDAFPTLDQLNSWWDHTHCTETPSVSENPSLRFIEQDETLSARSYELGIAQSGQIPTRSNNWHDLFNALAWIRYTRSKLTLNRAHLHHLGDNRSSENTRNRMRDFITLVDETGLVLCSSQPEHETMLRQHDWQALFVDARDDWHRSLHAYVIGHGLMEQILSPYVGLTAKTVFLNVEPEFNDLTHPERFSAVDDRLSRWLTAEAALDTPVCRSESTTQPDAASRRLMPLPVLGIPGWWPANEDHSFYRNQNYFRPLRVSRSR